MQTRWARSGKVPPFSIPFLVFSVVVVVVVDVIARRRFVDVHRAWKREAGP